MKSNSQLTTRKSHRTLTKEGARQINIVGPTNKPPILNIQCSCNIGHFTVQKRKWTNWKHISDMISTEQTIRTFSWPHVKDYRITTNASLAWIKMRSARRTANDWAEHNMEPNITELVATFHWFQPKLIISAKYLIIDGALTNFKTMRPKFNV